MEDEISQIVESYGAKLYGTETIKEGKNTIFRVYVIKEGGVELDICAEISRELSPFLDINPPVSGSYYLEVSSPGIERKLKTKKHFEYSIGENVSIKLLDGTKVQGVLKEVVDDKIKVETNFSVEEYKLSDIKIARTYFDW